MDVLERFAETLSPGDTESLRHVRDYSQWQMDQRQAAFEPDGDDDIDLRTYLMQLRLQGVEPTSLRQRTAALKQFYSWALAEGLIEYSPFDEFNFDRPFLSRDQIRRRESALDADPQERELRHLRALNRLAEQLNRSIDVQTALDVTLTTLVEVMNLHTAWTFITTESGLLRRGDADQSPHDFALVAACGLPPGLERDNRHYLRRPPDCHCQRVLRSGHLVRAVNVVECTRLLDSAQADGDNRGLLFHASTPIRVQDRALGIINVATDEWQFLTAADLTFLSAVGAQVAVALERAQLYDETNMQRIRLERELDMARAVQASLLPQRRPSIPGFGLAADWRSAREVAGDFYDIFELPHQRWGLVIGDVSDKGAPAALYMAMVRSLIRSAAAQSTSPARVLLEVDRSLRRLSTSGMFVTVFYAVLDPAAHLLIYANAGHSPPIVRRSTGPIQQLTRTGPLLGVFDQIGLDDETLQLEPGDVVVAYTDGLTEAFNANGEEYGVDRIIAKIADFPDTPADLLECLLSDLSAFAGSAPQADDITLFILRRN